jgi:hypothetical protein
MLSSQSSPLLRKALLADAVISGFTGLLMLFGAGFLSGMLDLPEAFLRFAGLVLLPYVVFVAYVTFQQPISRTAAWVVIVFNDLWAAASIYHTAARQLGEAQHPRNCLRTDPGTGCGWVLGNTVPGSAPVGNDRGLTTKRRGDESWVRLLFSCPLYHNQDKRVLSCRSSRHAIIRAYSSQTGTRVTLASPSSL